VFCVDAKSRGGRSHYSVTHSALNKERTATWLVIGCGFEVCVLIVNGKNMLLICQEIPDCDTTSCCNNAYKGKGHPITGHKGPTGGVEV
jgi:hypothetical protein